GSEVCCCLSDKGVEKSQIPCRPEYSPIMMLALLDGQIDVVTKLFLK
ncbi:MAG: hypothetical protein ACI9HY_004068, partial [Planctomycetaceae bacterium]